jgi:hypothetical protein
MTDTKIAEIEVKDIFAEDSDIKMPAMVDGLKEGQKATRWGVGWRAPDSAEDRASILKKVRDSVKATVDKEKLIAITEAKVERVGVHTSNTRHLSFYGVTPA